jgi:hypothetical protein
MQTEAGLRAAATIAVRERAIQRRVLYTPAAKKIRKNRRQVAESKKMNHEKIKF